MSEETFGQALRRLRGQTSVRGLARRANCSKSHIWDLEQGNRHPTPGVVRALDAALRAGGALISLAEPTGKPDTGVLGDPGESGVVESLAMADSPFEGTLVTQREEEEAREAQGNREARAAWRASDESLTDDAPILGGRAARVPPGFTELATGWLGAISYNEADMRRRGFIVRLGGTVALGAAGPELAWEAARHGLMLSVAEDRAETTIEEWQEIVSDYGFTYKTASPRELLDLLTVDVLAVQYAALAHDPDDSALRELRRVSGFLAAFMAMTVANLGRTREARRWWRTARRVVEKSGDLEAALWIRGREIVRAPYEGCPLPAVIQLAEQAESRVTPSAPRSALPGLFAGKAQSLARAGRRADAVAALERARESFTDLPAHVAYDHDSEFGWAEERLRFTESFVYSHLGCYDQADVASRRAVALYPASFRRDLAQIELLRAFCLVRSGDVTGGARHVIDTMSGLPREQHVRPVVDLGQQVLDAVPAGERHLPGVREVREYLQGE